MLDLRSDLDSLWRAAARLTPGKGGRAIMFMSIHEEAGTSSIAASFALKTASRSQKTTWLVDIDFANNSLIDAFETGFAQGVGRPGRPYDASLGQIPFFDVSVPGREQSKASLQSGKLLAAHQINGTRLLVTRFRNERLAYGQKVRLSTRSAWWKAARKSADWIIVDAPAFLASKASLNLVKNMDGVVLVVSGDKAEALSVMTLKREIEAAGGHVLGVVMNQMRADALLADRLAG